MLHMCCPGLPCTPPAHTAGRRTRCKARIRPLTPHCNPNDTPRVGNSHMHGRRQHSQCPRSPGETGLAHSSGTPRMRRLVGLRSPGEKIPLDTTPHIQRRFQRGHARNRTGSGLQGRLPRAYRTSQLRRPPAAHMQILRTDLHQRPCTTRIRPRCQSHSHAANARRGKAAIHTCQFRDLQTRSAPECRTHQRQHALLKRIPLAGHDHNRAGSAPLGT